MYDDYIFDNDHYDDYDHSYEDDSHCDDWDDDEDDGDWIPEDAALESSLFGDC